MHTSEGGIGLIKRFEGFPFGGRPYRDAVGVWTIGYGHTAGVGPGTRRITQGQADQLLRHDLAAKYEKYVNPWVKLAGLNQNEYDAIVSAVYNLGPGILARGRSMGDALRSRNRGRIADAFMVYVKAGGRVLEGLRIRRAAERHLFKAPVAQSRDQRLVTAWRARLARVRSEVRRRKAARQVGWTPQLKALANELEADIRRHS